MQKHVKELFLKALLISCKGLAALPILLFILVVYDTINIYHPSESYAIQSFKILTTTILIVIAFLIITPIKLWKILLLCLLLTTYLLMYSFNNDIRYSKQVQNCLERPTSCIDTNMTPQGKDQLN